MLRLLGPEVLSEEMAGRIDSRNEDAKGFSTNRVRGTHLFHFFFERLSRFIGRVGHNVVGLETNANGLVERMVVMAGHERENTLSIAQLKRVEEICTTKNLSQHPRLQRAMVIVHDIVWPEQDTDLMGRRALIAAAGSQRKFAERGGDMMVLLHAADECPIANKSGDLGCAGLMVDVVGPTPLNKATIKEHAKRVCHCKGLGLIMGDENCGGSSGLQDVSNLSGESAPKGMV